jgi:phosphatidylserine synthase
MSDPQARRQALGFLNARHLIPNSLTLIAGLFGISGSVFSLHGQLKEAAWLLVASAVIDKVDGFVARKAKAQHPIGARLDSFADLLNYGSASSLFVFGLLSHTGKDALGWAVGGVIATNAILRLAAFDYLEDHPDKVPPRDILGNAVQGPGKDFMGMPSTMMGLNIPYLYWVFGTQHPEMFAATSLISGALMFAPLRYGKLTDNIWEAGRKAVRVIRHPLGIVGSGMFAGALGFLGYHFPQVAETLAQVTVGAGLAAYAASPFLETFFRFFGSDRSGNSTPPPSEKGNANRVRMVSESSDGSESKEGSSQGFSDGEHRDRDREEQEEDEDPPPAVKARREE